MSALCQKRTIAAIAKSSDEARIQLRRVCRDGKCRPQRCSGRLFAMSDKDFVHHIEHAHPKLFWHWGEPRRGI